MEVTGQQSIPHKKTSIADLLVIALIFVFVGFGLFVYQTLEHQNEVQDLVQANNELEEENLRQVLALQTRIEELSSLLKKEEPELAYETFSSNALAEALKNIDLKNLPQGLYQVTAPVVVSVGVPRPGSPGNTVEKEYTIYHIKTEIEANGSTHPIHAGIATSGYLTAPKIYVDYDADGVVDVHAMYELVTLLPFHQLVSRSVNPTISQEVYISFLTHHKNAEFTEIKSISEHGSYLVRGLWKVLTEQGSRLLGGDEETQVPEPAE